MNNDFNETLSVIIRKSRVNFLLGAGASYKDSAKDTSYPLMKDLVNEIVKCPKHDELINSFSNDSLVFKCFKKYMLERKNFEDYLSSLEGLANYPYSISTEKNILQLIHICKNVVINRIRNSSDNSILPLYEMFYKNLIAFNKEKEEVFKRINIFTTNYDMLTEIALENIGIHYYSGFFGIKRRRFNPTFYNFTYSDDMNLSTKNYIIKNEHVNLYKLHGSLSWRLVENELIEIQDYENNSDPVIIYPSHTKYNQSNLVAYYSSLMREFLNQISNEQSSLIVIGYSFGDDHLNKLIQSALSIESFTLVALLFSDDDFIQFNEKIGSRPNVKLYRGVQAKLEDFVSFIGECVNETY